MISPFDDEEVPDYSIEEVLENGHCLPGTRARAEQDEANDYYYYRTNLERGEPGYRYPWERYNEDEAER